jgi:hypothetical protein
MKYRLLLIVALLGSVRADEKPAAPPESTPPPASDYAEFVKQLGVREVAADLAARLDELIDTTEKRQEDSPNGSACAASDTKNGIHLEFCMAVTSEATLYYFVVSRQGEELHLSDATKIGSFFCDRAGLPHPTALAEGEKPVFGARWLIKPSEWKSMRKMMLKVRAENRAEPNPLKAFTVAIIRELDARGVPRGK